MRHRPRLRNNILWPQGGTSVGFAAKTPQGSGIAVTAATLVISGSVLFVFGQASAISDRWLSSIASCC